LTDFVSGRFAKGVLTSTLNSNKKLNRLRSVLTLSRNIDELGVDVVADFHPRPIPRFIYATSMIIAAALSPAGGAPAQRTLG
jgi:hypothetical protein